MVREGGVVRVTIPGGVHGWPVGGVGRWHTVWDSRSNSLSFMYSLDTRYPGAAVGLAEVLDQAARDAEAVPGAYATAPWRFLHATAAAAALLEGLETSRYRWVIVAFRRCDAMGHVKERAYTAVQRYLLSLAAEDVEATWIGSGLPEALSTYASLGPTEEILGVIRIEQ